MKTVSATEIKNRLGVYLEESLLEPVVVQKAGRPVAVVISYREYERLTKLEDSYWAARARMGEQSGFIGEAESMKLLQELQERSSAEP